MTKQISVKRSNTTTTIPQLKFGEMALNTANANPLLAVGNATGTANLPIAMCQSPALIGTPTTTTATQNDNSTRIASTAYIDGKTITSAVASPNGTIVTAGSLASGSETIDTASFVKGSISTGLITGGIITSTTPTFSISAGSGVIVNNETNPASPTITNVTISASTGNAITTGVAVNYIMINSAGAVVVSTTKPTTAQRRLNIYLGKLILNNAKTGILIVMQDPYVQYNIGMQFHNLISASYRNQGAISTSANGANMNINLSGGTLIGDGVGYTTDITSPNALSVSSATAITFRMATQTAIIDATTTTLPNAANYDNAGTLTANGGTNNSSINHRVFLQSNGNIIIQYGQLPYTNLANAVAGIPTESFVLNPINIVGNSLLIGFISVTKNATNLSSGTQATFTPAGTFGEASGGTSSSVSFTGANGVSVAGSIISGIQATTSQIGVVTLSSTVNGSSTSNVATESQVATKSDKVPNVLPIGNLISGGLIGTAPLTVDIYEKFDINQTTGGQALTLPSPTGNVKKIIYVENTGNVAFSLANVSVAPNTFLTLIFDGTQWAPSVVGSSGGGGGIYLSGANTTATSSVVGSYANFTVTSSLGVTYTTNSFTLQAGITYSIFLSVSVGDNGFQGTTDLSGWGVLDKSNNTLITGFNQINAVTYPPLGTGGTPVLVSGSNSCIFTPSVTTIVGAGCSLAGVAGGQYCASMNLLIMQTNGSGGANGITTLTGDVTASGTGSVASTIGANAVTNSKLAQMAQNTLKGNNAVLGTAIDLTVAQVTTMIANTTPTASTIAEWDVNTNLRAKSFVSTITSTTSSSTPIPLSVSSSEYQRITGILPQTITLPNATTLLNAQTFRILNESTGAVTVQDFGSNILGYVSSNNDANITLISNLTTAGTWHLQPNAQIQIPQFSSQEYTSARGSIFIYKNSLWRHGEGTSTPFDSSNNAALNRSTYMVSNVPVLTTTGAITGWKDVVYTYSGACALTNDGRVFQWGAITGQTTSTYATQVSFGGALISKIYSPSGKGATFVSFYAISTAGVLYAWGDNTWGQLGNGTVTTASSPVACTGAVVGKTITKVAVSGDRGIHVLAIDNAGALYGWGYGTNVATASPIGSGVGATNVSTPISISLSFNAGKTVTDIVALCDFETGSNNSRNFSRILMSDGTSWATGVNGSGQLANNTFNHSTVFVRETTNKTNIVAIGGGQTFAGGVSYIIDSAGIIYFSGNNYNSCFGDGTATNSAHSTFTNATQLTNAGFQGKLLPNGNGIIPKVAFGGTCDSGYNFGVILDNTGTLWTVGYNNSGNLGLGVSGVDVTVWGNPMMPTTGAWVVDFNIIGDPGIVEGIMIAMSDGTLACCGNNPAGELPYESYPTNFIAPYMQYVIGFGLNNRK